MRCQINRNIFSPTPFKLIYNVPTNSCCTCVPHEQHAAELTVWDFYETSIQTESATFLLSAAVGVILLDCDDNYIQFLINLSSLCVRCHSVDANTIPTITVSQLSMILTIIVFSCLVTRGDCTSTATTDTDTTITSPASSSVLLWVFGLVVALAALHVLTSYMMGSSSTRTTSSPSNLTRTAVSAELGAQSGDRHRPTLRLSLDDVRPMNLDADFAVEDGGAVPEVTGNGDTTVSPLSPPTPPAQERGQPACSKQSSNSGAGNTPVCDCDLCTTPVAFVPEVFEVSLRNETLQIYQHVLTAAALERLGRMCPRCQNSLVRRKVATYVSDKCKSMDNASTREAVLATLKKWKATKYSTSKNCPACKHSSDTYKAARKQQPRAVKQRQDRQSQLVMQRSTLEQSFSASAPPLTSALLHGSGAKAFQTPAFDFSGMSEVERQRESGHRDTSSLSNHPVTKTVAAHWLHLLQSEGFASSLFGLASVPSEHATEFEDLVDLCAAWVRWTTDTSLLRLSPAVLIQLFGSGLIGSVNSGSSVHRSGPNRRAPAGS